ncbi:hypothetical protein [Geodermatophilus sp. URMC 65]
MRVRPLIIVVATSGIGAKLGGLLSRPMGARGQVQGAVTSVIEDIAGTVNAAQSGSPRFRSARLRWLREVRDMDNPGRHAVVFIICTDPTRCPSQFTVPAGKRLVIEYVSARLTTPAGQASAIGFHTTTNGTGATSYIPSEEGAGDERIVGRRVWLTADPGSTVVYQSAGAASGDMVLSGYLIDVP